MRVVSSDKRGNGTAKNTTGFRHRKGEKHMRSELTILALWAAIYITGLILAMFLIAVVLCILQ